MKQVIHFLQICDHVSRLNILAACAARPQPDRKTTAEKLTVTEYGLFVPVTGTLLNSVVVEIVSSIVSLDDIQQRKSDPLAGRSQQAHSELGSSRRDEICAEISSAGYRGPVDGRQGSAGGRDEAVRSEADDPGVVPEHREEIGRTGCHLLTCTTGHLASIVIFPSRFQFLSHWVQI